MFDWLIGKKTHEKRILAVDVGTASVSAAIVHEYSTSSGNGVAGGYDVKKVLRYPFNIRDSHQVFLSKLKKMFKDASVEERRPDTVLISFSDPFFIEYKAAKKIARPSPTKAIAVSEIENIIVSLEKDAASKKQLKDSLPPQSMLVVAGKQVLGQKVNGYLLPSSLGYSGKSLEVEAKFLFLQKYLKDSLEESKNAFYPAGQIRYYSDAYVLWQAFKASGKLSEPVLALDIGGEMTGIFWASQDTLEHATPAQFGVRTLERRLANFLGKDSYEADSILRRYSSGTLDEATAVKIQELLSGALSDWWEEVNVSLRELQFKPMPKIAIFAGGGADFSVFATAFRENFKKNYGIGVDARVFLPEEFRDRFISLGALVGGSDAVLLSLILFHRNFL